MFESSSVYNFLSTTCNYAMSLNRYIRLPSWLRVRRHKPAPPAPRQLPRIIYLIPPHIVITPPDDE